MKAAIVQNAIPSGTGTQDLTDANISSDFKGALLFSSSASANATNTAIARFMVGATDGSTHRSAAMAAADAAGTTQTSGGNSTNVYQVINSNGGTNETAAYSSTLSNGLRVNWTAIATQRLVNAILLSGSDVEVHVSTAPFTNAAAPETVSVTHGHSSAPDVVIAFSYLGSGRFSIGFYDRATASYGAVSYTNITGQAGNVTLGGYVSNNAIIRQVSASANEYAATLGNFTATTFDVTATGATTNDTISFVTIRVTGATSKVGVLTCPTSPGDVSESGMSGAPILLLLLPTRITNINALDSGDGAGTLGLGAAANNNGTLQQACSVLSSNDGAATTVERSYTTNARALVVQDVTGASDMEADAAMNSDGFTLSFSSVSGSACLAPFLALGVASSGPIWPQRRHRRTTLIAM